MNFFVFCLFSAVVIVILLWMYTMLPGGCSGDCKQGRLPCNCPLANNDGSCNKDSK